MSENADIGSENPRETDFFTVNEPPVVAEGLKVLNGETPWLTPDILPDKPYGMHYGVKFRNDIKNGNKIVPVESEEALRRTIQGNESKIEAVFLPNEEKGVPLRSLSWFRPLKNKDFVRFFLTVLRTQGLLGAIAIGAAIYFHDHPYAPMGFIFGLLFGVIPVFDALVQWIMYPKNQTDEVRRESIVHWSVFNRWIADRKRAPWPTWLTVGIFIAVYVGQLTSGILESAVINGQQIRQNGEWWRLFTGTLMHDTTALKFLHLFMNSLGLVYLGRYLHRLANPFLVPIVFVVTAFVGALASAAFLGPEKLGSLGASGGVLGLMGFLMWLAISRRHAFPYEFKSFMLRNVILISVLGILLIQVVDNYGHAGGFLAGLVCGLIYDLFHRKKWSVPTTPVTGALAFVSFLVMLFGMATCMDLFFYDGQMIVSHLPRVPW